MDSGCRNHMVGNKHLFTSIYTYATPKIKLCNDFQVQAKSKGIVFGLTKQNEKKCIHNVFYVPHIKYILINIG